VKKFILISITLASFEQCAWAIDGCELVSPKPVRVYSGAPNGDLVYTITDEKKTVAIDDDSGFVGLRLGATAILHSVTTDKIPLNSTEEKKKIVAFTRQRIALFRKKVQSESPDNFEKLKAPLDELDRILGNQDGPAYRADLANALEDVEKNFGNMKVQSKTKTVSSTGSWGPETDVSKLSLPDYRNPCDYIRLNPSVLPGSKPVIGVSPSNVQ